MDGSRCETESQSTHGPVLDDHEDQVHDLGNALRDLRGLDGKVHHIDGRHHLVGLVRELGKTNDVVLHRGRVDGRDEAGEGSKSKGSDAEELHGNETELRGGVAREVRWGVCRSAGMQECNGMRGSVDRVNNSYPFVSSL
jgi:hypothetical protein